MPGVSCNHSARKRNSVFQKAVDIFRLNNQEYYTRAVNDGWYANATAFHDKLKRGAGLEIMGNFEEVATRLNLGKTESDNMRHYLTAYSLDDAAWKLLNDFDSFFKRKQADFPDKKRWQQWDYFMKKAGEGLKMSENMQDLVRDLAVMEEGFTRASFEKIAEGFAAKDIASINRFGEYIKQQGFSEMFLYFLKKTNNSNGFITEAVSHESYLGLLNEMYKDGSYARIKAANPELKSTDDILDKYMFEKVSGTFPELTPEKVKALADKFLLKKEKAFTSSSPLVNGIWNIGKVLINEARIVSTMLRFTVGGTSGALMLNQNFFTTGMHYKGVTKGLDKSLLEHKLVDQLVDAGYFNVATDYENYRALFLGSSKETYIEKIYNATLHKAVAYGASYLPFVTKEMAGKSADFMRDITLTGLHNAQDHVWARKFERAGITKAAMQVWGDDFDQVLKQFESGMIPEEQLNKFIALSKLYGQSGNNAFTSEFLRGNRFTNGPWAVLNYLSSYPTHRLGEFQHGLKKLTDAVVNGEIKSISDFNKHLWNTNPEMQKALNVVLDSVQLGFFLDTYYDKEDTNNPRDYGKLYNEYLNSFQAAFIGRIFSSIYGNNHDLKTYRDVTGKEISTLGGIPIQVLKFLDDLVPMMFRELDFIKHIPQVTRSFREGDARLNVALRKEALERMMNGSYRFNMPEGVDALGQISLPEEDDIIGLLSLGMHTTNASIELADEMFNVDAIDKFVKGDDGKGVFGDWISEAMTRLPLLEIAYGNSLPSSAKWAAFKQVRDEDPILKAVYGKDDDVFLKYILQFSNDKEKFMSESKEFFTDLIDFDYSQWNKEFPLNDVLKKNFYNKSAAYDNIAKEELFTTILKEAVGEDILKDADELFEKKQAIGGEVVDKAILSRSTVEEAGIQKLLMTSEAKAPGSARIIIAYLANKEFYQWKLDNAPKGSITGKDQGSLDDTWAGAVKRAEITAYYHPYMYYADKHTYLKVLRNQLKNTYPEAFSDINDSQKQFVNGLILSDFIAHREALSGKPSASYVASVVSNTNRYMKSDLDRIAAMNYKFERIAQLNSVDPEIRQMVQVGMLYPNTDIIHRLWQDKEFRKNPDNERALQYATNYLYDTVDDIAFKGSNIHALTEKDFDDNYSGAKSSSAGKKFYKQYTGSAYSQKPSNTGNSFMQDKLLSSANKYGSGGARQYYQPNTSSYSRTTPREYNGYSPEELYSVPRPRVIDTMIRIGRTQGVQRIVSPTLLKQTVKRGVLAEDGTYRRPTSAQFKKRIQKPKKSIPNIRTPKIKKRGPNVQLPGGTINVG